MNKVIDEGGPLGIGFQEQVSRGEELHRRRESRDACQLNRMTPDRA